MWRRSPHDSDLQILGDEQRRRRLGDLGPFGGGCFRGHLFTKHFKVPKMEVRTHLYKLYGHGLCKGKPHPQNSRT